MSLSLRTLLRAGLGALTALAVVSSLITIHELHQIRSAQQHVWQQGFPAVLAAERVSQGVVEASFAYRNYMIYGENPELAAKYDKARLAGFNKSFSNLQFLNSLHQEQELVQTIERDIRDGNLRIQDETLSDVVGKGPAARKRALEHMKSGSGLVAKTSADCQELARRVQAALSADQSATIAASLFATKLTILCAVLAALAGIGMAVKIIRSLMAGIDRILERTRCIAGGNLKPPMGHRESPAEIETALGGIEEMRGMLAQTVAGVINSTLELVTASEELTATSDTMAKSASQQNSETEQVATAMHEMTSTVVSVSENSRAASDKADSARQSAHEGGAVVREMVEMISGVAESTSVIANKIEELGKSGDQIGRIVGVIEEIADQTNLLALNAAIEAARAGEQGRGFAVVADEVRKLAERTTTATHEISEMVTMIQQETRGAVKVMQAGSGKVEQGVLRSQKAGEALSRIIESADGVQEMIAQIATAATEQAATTEQVNQNLQRIATVVHESSTGAAESAKACESLSTVARRLEKLVQRFQIDGEVSVRKQATGWEISGMPTADAERYAGGNSLHLA